MTVKTITVSGVVYTEYNINNRNPVRRRTSYGIIIFQDNASGLFEVIKAESLLRTLGSLRSNAKNGLYSHSTPRILKELYPINLFDNITIYFKEFPSGSELQDGEVQLPPSRDVVKMNLLGYWLNRDKEAKKVHAIRNCLKKDTGDGCAYLKFICPDLLERLDLVESINSAGDV
jgi:hypothetical protein